MCLRHLARVCLPLFFLAACGAEQDGSGTITIAHRETQCPLKVILNGDTHFTVQPGATVERLVRAGGQELQFESDEGCFIYTNHEYSPFDSGRNLCNTVVSDGEKASFSTRGRSRGTHREVNVECPE